MYNFSEFMRYSDNSNTKNHHKSCCVQAPNSWGGVYVGVPLLFNKISPETTVRKY